MKKVKLLFLGAISLVVFGFLLPQVYHGRHYREVFPRLLQL